MLDLAVVAHQTRGPQAAHRPRRHAGDDLGAVERQRPRRLGEDLVVTDEHPDPPDRGIEGGKPVAGGVDAVLAGRDVDLAMVSEHPVPADAHGAGEDLIRPAGRRLGVADADHRRPGDPRQPREHRVAVLEHGRGGPPDRRAHPAPRTCSRPVPLRGTPRGRRRARVRCARSAPPAPDPLARLSRSGAETAATAEARANRSWGRTRGHDSDRPPPWTDCLGPRGQSSRRVDRPRRGGKRPLRRGSRA